jgi:hypothetical protein
MLAGGLAMKQQDLAHGLFDHVVTTTKELLDLVSQKESDLSARIPALSVSSR